MNKEIVLEMKIFIFFWLTWICLLIISSYAIYSNCNQISDPKICLTKLRQTVLLIPLQLVIIFSVILYFTVCFQLHYNKSIKAEIMAVAVMIPFLTVLSAFASIIVSNLFTLIIMAVISMLPFTLYLRNTIAKFKSHQKIY